MLSLKSVFSLIKWVILIFICFLAQLFLMPVWSFNEVVPNLLLVLIIISALKFGLETALPLALFLTYLQSFFLYDGFFLVSWLIAPFLAIYLKPEWNFSPDIMVIFQIVFCSFYIELINAFFFSFSYGINTFAENYWILLLSPILNGLLALPTTFALNKIFSLEE